MCTCLCWTGFWFDEEKEAKIEVFSNSKEVLRRIFAWGTLM